jgi:hypothetical protein
MGTFQNQYIQWQVAPANAIPEGINSLNNYRNTELSAQSRVKSE